MQRRPALYLLTSLLALATAVALLGTGLTLSASGVADPRPVATEQVVRAFYAAVNQVIATGDPTALDRVVVDDLVTHGALGAIAPGRAGLLRYLASLHATQPGLELAVEQVVTTRDQALVHLAVRGGAEGGFLGSPWRGGAQLWGAVDALRVEGKRVVEYWGGERGLVLLEPIGEASFAVAAPASRVVSLDRLSIAPGATFAAAGAEEARVLVVETGTVRVTTGPRIDVQPSDHAPLAERLAAGDLLALPTWSRTDVRNEGKEAASVLVLAAETRIPNQPEMRPWAEVGPGLTRWQAGVPRTSASGAIVAPLTGNVLTALPGERAVVAVGRVTLAAGVTLPAFEAGGPHLLVVNTGIVELAAREEAAWIYLGTGSYLKTATLGVANGALLHAGAGASLFNAGPDPTVVTIVAILPDDRAGPPA